VTLSTAARDRLIGVALALITTVVVISSQRDVGIARDEVVYMQHGAKYADWWTGLATFSHGLSGDSIGDTFGCRPSVKTCESTANNREHPPLMKTLFGLSDKLLDRDLGIVDEVTAFRLPSAIMHGVCVYLVFAMALALWGLAEGVLAGVLLALLPRALFHAGLACFDAPSMTLWFATVYAYWKCLDGRTWPWQVGVVWGLALATKHTALLLPFALGVHYLIVGYRASTPRWPGILAHRWRVIASVAVLGPLVLLALWPWLWLSPIGHVHDWLAFHLEHVNYNFEYLGHNWNAPPFPWHVAIVTTLFTVPTATLAAAVAGSTRWILQWRAKDSVDKARAPVLLLALSLAAAMGPFMLGSTPIFGAEKHWMPALPTICIAGAVGIVWTARRAAAALRVPAIAAIAVVGGAVAIAGATEVVTSHPYALTWYSAAAGGAPGGADLGMNRQFWGVSARGVLPVLDADAPPAGSRPRYVYTHDASPAWGLYQKEGLVSKTLADSGYEQAGVDHSSLAIVIHELHFNRHDYMIWKSYGSVRPSFVLRADGVPIVSVYRRDPLPPP
jgi:hypothetical protein